MRPTFLGFEASKTALFASQKALDITGNNLSNINSEGYTRQRVDQVSVNYMNNSTTGYIGTKVALAGQGTSVVGIGQTRDKQLDTAFRNQCSEIGEQSEKLSFLSDIEDALQEFDVGDSGNGYGLRNGLSNLFDALQDFSSDAGSSIYASTVSDSFKQLALTIREMSDNLDDVETKYKSSLQDDIATVNTSLQEVAYLNKKIKEALVSNDYTGEYGPNELLDERNQILDELSVYGELSVKYNSDGTVDVSMGDKTAVKGLEYDELTYHENSDGTVRVDWKSTGEHAYTGQGTLEVDYNMLNGRGVNMQSSNETSEKGLLYYRDKVNEFAVQLTAICNNTIPDSVDEDGNVISYKKIFGKEGDDGEVYPDMHVSASDIWITEDLETNSSYLLNNNGADTDNSGILNLTAQLTSSKFEFSGFTGTLEDFVNDYVTGLGSSISYVQESYDASVEAGNTIEEMRESVSGVSETEETTNMLMYNRAFQAAARMMTVMDDLLDVIINQMAV